MHSYVFHLNVDGCNLNPDCISKKIASHRLRKTDQCLPLDWGSVLINDQDRLSWIRVLIRIPECSVRSYYANDTQPIQVGAIPLALTNPPGHYRFVAYQIYFRIGEAGPRVDVGAPCFHIVA